MPDKIYLHSQKCHLSIKEIEFLCHVLMSGSQNVTSKTFNVAKTAVITTGRTQKI